MYKIIIQNISRLPPVPRPLRDPVYKLCVMRTCDIQYESVYQALGTCLINFEIACIQLQKGPCPGTQALLRPSCDGPSSTPVENHQRQIKRFYDILKVCIAAVIARLKFDDQSFTTTVWRSVHVPIGASPRWWGCVYGPSSR